MTAAFHSPTITVLITKIDTVEWVKMDTNTKVIIYRVLQELLVDMKKHSKCNLALLTFKKIENKLQIFYTDNKVGVGNYELSLKNGSQNVENRIITAKGNITFDGKPEKGFRVKFSFPI